MEWLTHEPRALKGKRGEDTGNGLWHTIDNFRRDNIWTHGFALGCVVSLLLNIKRRNEAINPKFWKDPSIKIPFRTSILKKLIKGGVKTYFNACKVCRPLICSILGSGSEDSINDLESGNGLGATPFAKSWSKTFERLLSVSVCGRVL